MKTRFTLFCTLFLLVFSGCATTQPQNTVTQTSTIDALLAGVYDDGMSCDRLMTYGTLGIGTFDRLDGEMILLNGEMYQVKSDGRVHKPNGTLTSPFAAVCSFSPDEIIAIEKYHHLSGAQKTPG